MDKQTFTATLLPALAIVAACSAGAAGSLADGGSDLHDAEPSEASSTSNCAGVNLPIQQASDPSAAARGYEQLSVRVLGQGYVPVQALASLGLVSSTKLPIVLPGHSATESYWAAFRARYGFYTAPFDNGGYPMGIQIASNGMASFDCLTCHANVVAGRTLIGVGNSQLDLQGLFDDLAQLRIVAQSSGFAVPPLRDVSRRAVRAIRLLRVAHGCGISTGAGVVDPSLSKENVSRRIGASGGISHDDGDAPRVG